MILRFSKCKRLLRSADFGAVLRARHITQNAFFRIYVRPNTLPVPRLGLTVAKKINKHAYQRNSIKRLAREWFRLHQWQFPSVDIVIQARCQYDKTKREQFWGALEGLEDHIAKPFRRKSIAVTPNYQS